MTNKLIKELKISGQACVNCIEFNPNSLTMAYGGSDRTVKYWELENYSLLSSTSIDKKPIIKIQFDQSGKYIYSGTDSSIKIWDLDNDKALLIEMYETGWNKLHDLRNLNGNIFALSSFANKVAFWELRKESNLRLPSIKSNHNNTISEINNTINKSIMNQSINSDFSSILDILVPIDISIVQLCNPLNNGHILSEDNSILNINYESFIGNSFNNQICDISIIGDVFLYDNQFESIYRKRNMYLSKILREFNQSNMSNSFNQLIELKDLPVINDFFYWIFLRNDIKKINFSFQQCLCIIKFAIKLIDSTHEYYHKNGFEMTIHILCYVYFSNIRNYFISKIRI